VNRSLSDRSLDDFSATASVSRLINGPGDGTLRLNFVDAILICKAVYFVRSEELRAVIMEITIFWDVTPFSQLFLLGGRIQNERDY
jgi:hypothetical protein